MKSLPALPPDLVARSESSKLDPHAAASRSTRRHLIRFDPQRRAADPSVRQAAWELARSLEQHEHRKRRRTEEQRAAFRLAVEVIACNLIAARIIGPRVGIAVQRGHDMVFSHARYREPVYGRHFIAALDLMESAKLITAKQGFRFSEESSQPSTIRATKLLASHLPLTDAIGWPAIRHGAPKEVLLLKAPKDRKGHAKLLDYEDSAATNRLRRQVRKLNARLAAAPLTLLETIDSQDHALDPMDRSLTRSFSNGSWQEGGRLGGGFWMGMARADRFKLIRIDGEPIVSADYGQCQPRLAYALAGAEPPDGDLYYINGDGTCRDGLKKLFTALLFSKPPGLRNWPKDCRALFGEHPPKLSDAVDAIIVKHWPVAHLLDGSRVGFNLMKTESDMLLDVLDALFGQGIAALPLHDAVLVGRRHAKAARDAMLATAKRHAG
jgi:hypothetical protein